MANKEEKVTHPKAKSLGIIGNILGCLTIVIYSLKSTFSIPNLENTALITAFLTFISYFIGNIILKSAIGMIASFILTFYLIIILLTYFTKSHRSVIYV